MASLKTRVAILASAILLLLIGGTCWAIQTTIGLRITGLSNSFSWGLYIAAFAFFVGVAAGGMIISSSVYLFNVERLKPFARIASLSAFGCIVAAGAMILLDLGKISNILNLFIHPNFASPLVWDIGVITCYMIITFLSVNFQMLPEWQKSGSFFAGRAKKRKLDDVVSFSKKWSKRVALVGLPLAVLIHTVTALIFATQASRHWWHSAILPPDFVAVAVASGAALVLIICMLAVGRSGFERHEDAFGIMAKIIAGSLVVHFFFTAMELVLLVWENSLEAAEILHIVFVDYGILYAIEILLPAIAMIVFFKHRAKDSPRSLYLMSIFVILGAFVHRLMLMFPGFNAFPLTLQPSTSNELWAYPVASGVNATPEVFVQSVSYAPTLLEIGVTLFPFGLALLIVGGCIAWLRFIVDSEPFEPPV
jgi:molybdopterin-containing oxidoreductase family membrane subunit